MRDKLRINEKASTSIFPCPTPEVNVFNIKAMNLGRPSGA
jgi:hypothetical protein